VYKEKRRSSWSLCKEKTRVAPMEGYGLAWLRWIEKRREDQQGPCARIKEDQYGPNARNKKASRASKKRK
jgi:hypothetical protein